MDNSNNTGSSNPSSEWGSREISTNTEDGVTCTQSSTPKRAPSPSPPTSVEPVVVQPNSNNNNNDDDNHNKNLEPSQSPWVYRYNAQRQLQQLWSELHFTGQQPVRNESMQGIQDDLNDSNPALRSSSAASEKVPADLPIEPMLEYSCGSLLYDASSWGSDHNMDQPLSPPLPHRVSGPNHSLPPHHHQIAFPANAANSAIWGTNSISTDWNKSAVSVMDEDCSSVSLDLFSALGDVTESSNHHDPMVVPENHRSSLTLLDSSMSGTDLNGSYKPSVFSNPVKSQHPYRK
jgi:hypothetical protein